MRLVLTYLLPLLALTPLAAAPAHAAAAASESVRDTYIVSFHEAPLASFRGLTAKQAGGGVPMAATSPVVTGAPFDVDAPASRAYRTHLDELRRQRIDAASSRLGRELQPGFVYDVVNNAVSLELSAAEAAALAVMSGVQLVERETIEYPQTDAGPGWIHADQVWNAAAPLGNRGAGSVIGVIDGGINVSHPSFAGVGPVDGHAHVNPRGRFYGLCNGNPTLCNNKLIGIHDHTSCLGTHATEGCEDKEPNNGHDVGGHGSHVAATAAGNVLTVSFSLPGGDFSRTVSGVAPHASIISYKACEEGSCRGSWTLAAVNAAVADGVDVINYSLGGSASSPWNGSGMQAMLSARDAKVLVVAAGGNSGPGAGSLTSPANAPWVLAVANSTHDRRIVNRLIGLQGGDTPPPSGGILLGAGDTAGFGPAPLLIPSDHPGCSIGDDIDVEAAGASSPWDTDDRFEGEIVLCQRGTQARVAKSANVRLAGGGGMVLLNQASDGEGTAADRHSLPSTHLGFTAGSALLKWMESGSGHTGQIAGSQLVDDAAFGDILAASSGRGPVAAGDFLKPALSAPGSVVLAAAGTGQGFRFLSGTSMASPHIAGAVALLRAAHPDWTIDDIESALITTSMPIQFDSDGKTLAGPFEQGAGRANLAAALRAGLSFRATRADHLAANPATGGDSRALNRAALIDSNCLQNCSITRVVRDIAGGGSWRAEFVGHSGLAVAASPATFTLANGASQTLRFDFAITPDAPLEQWLTGRIRLIPTAAGTSTSEASVPVAIHSSAGNIPAGLNVQADSERGFVDIELSGIVALSDLQLSTSALAAPVEDTRTLPQDPSRDDPYTDIGNGSFVKLLRVPGGSERLARLLAETRSTESVDVDLFVGIDSNGNGAPDADEELCKSTSPDATEECDITFLVGSDDVVVWVLVQNWQAGATGNDSVTLTTTLVDESATGNGSVVATGPATTQSMAGFPVRLAWDIPALLPGDTRSGSVHLATSGGHLTTIPLKIIRSGSQSVAARALVPARTEQVRLLPGQAHDRLFIDVPANASALLIQATDGSDFAIYAARATPTAGPATGSAPARSSAAASVLGSAADKTLRIDGQQLQPGRWFITPVNTSGAPSELLLKTTIEYATARQPLTAGAYFNPERSGAGAFVFEIGESWGFIWYSYLQDGTPTWYLGAAPRPTAEQGVWRVSLERYTWNGTAARATTVGEAVLSFSEPESFQFSWSLDAETGSERYVWIDAGNCPTNAGNKLDATGIWFSPSSPGFGYSVNTASTIETHAAYFYDAHGVARWLFGTTAPFGATSIPLDTLFGFCPMCAYQAPVVVSSGVLTRRFDSGEAGEIGVDFALPAPMTGSWSVSLPAARMTNTLGCN